MDRDKLREILLDDFDMQAYHIDATIKQVEELEDGLKDSLFEFLQTKKVPDIEVGKYSCKSLVEKHKFTVIGALFLLDWLKKDVEAAEASLMFI